LDAILKYLQDHLDTEGKRNQNTCLGLGFSFLR